MSLLLLEALHLTDAKHANRIASKPIGSLRPPTPHAE